MWPGVWISSIGISPTMTVSPDVCSTSSDVDAPVTRCTQGASSACTWIGTGLIVKQLAHARDRVAHHVAADVIRVIVGGECAGESHVVCGEHVEEPADVVRRIDDHGFARLAVADEVDEVDHLPSDRIVVAKSRPARSWRK